MEIVCNNLMKAIVDMKAFLAIATANLTDGNGEAFDLSLRQMKKEDDEGFACVINYQKKRSNYIPTFETLRFFYDRSLKRSPIIQTNLLVLLTKNALMLVAFQA